MYAIVLVCDQNGSFEKEIVLFQRLLHNFLEHLKDKYFHKTDRKLRAMMLLGGL